MPRSEAQKKADAKYAEKFFLLRVKLPLDEKAALDEHLNFTGESATAFVKRAIRETIKRDVDL